MRTAGIAAAIVGELLSAGVSQLCVTSSVSLQFLPYDVAVETQLPADVKARLGFAVQKLAEIATTARNAKPGM
jgi:5-methyltetrahydropteroyltriglutamate--homocysteine methyltransferase